MCKLIFPAVLRIMSKGTSSTQLDAASAAPSSLMGQQMDRSVAGCVSAVSVSLQEISGAFNGLEMQFLPSLQSTYRGNG